MPTGMTADPAFDSSAIWAFERVAREFSHFVRTFKNGEGILPYNKQVLDNIRIGLSSLTVRLGDISTHNGPLHEQIISRPLQCLPALEQGILDAYYRTALGKTFEDVNPDSPGAVTPMQLVLTGGTPITVRQLDARRMEKLVTVSAIVVQVARPQSKARVLKCRCRHCEDVQYINMSLHQENVQLPKTCFRSRSAIANASNATGGEVVKCPPNPYDVVHQESSFWDYQFVKVQEMPEHVPAGDMPRPLTMRAGRHLCNMALPGARVQIVGVFTSGHRRAHTGNDRVNQDNDVEVRASAFQVLGITAEHRLGGGVEGFRSDISSEEIQKFQRFSEKGDAVDRIVSCIAPSIFARNDLKKAVACSLFSAPRKQLNDGTHLRGDINVLLLGDPGTAKSQLLKFAQRVAPIAIFTSGKGASAAGLTAAITRDMNGNFALEGGAMVLADGGLVCIDEFDKMRSEDRVAIHEAMEQQTISIAKAGITTVLNSRCSVLAAANPQFGSFQYSSEVAGASSSSSQNSKEQRYEHNFESTILSRFDMIFLVKDSMDMDVQLAKHVIQLHSDGGDKANSSATGLEDGKAELTTDELRMYIHYARHHVFPKLSETATKMLEDHYVEVRQAVKKAANNGDNAKRAIPITVRQLDAIERISEALARMELATLVEQRHVEQAINLFQTSTMEAINGGVNVDSMDTLNSKQVRMAEEEIKSRVSIGARKEITVLRRELQALGIHPRVIDAAIAGLLRRNEFTEKGTNIQRLSRSL